MTGIWRVIRLMVRERPISNVGGGDTNDAYRKEDVMSQNMIISDRSYQSDRRDPNNRVDQRDQKE